jgi:hypothetical protein
MGARRHSATQSEITRALKAAKLAGVNVGRFEVDGNKIVIVAVEAVKSEPETPLAVWKASRGSR